MDTAEVFERLSAVGRECQKKLGDGTGWLLDPDEVVIGNEDDPDEVGKWYALHEMISHLDDFSELLRYYEAPVAGEGILRKQKNGRYHIGDCEITAGCVIEILEEDEDRPCWVRTGIEHDGHDYYATRVKGVLEGRRARYR